MPQGGPNVHEARQEAIQATSIRAAVEQSHAALLRSIAILVAKTHRHLSWPAVTEMACEILNEAVQKALQQAQRFDPDRSATAWIRGIAARLLLARRRLDVRDARQASAAVVGEEAWVAALESCATGSTDAAVSERLDLEAALARLQPGDRKAIELRYFRSLDGEALASALGAASSGAARVRVYRALQALKALFSSAQDEVDS